MTDSSRTPIGRLAVGLIAAGLIFTALPSAPADAASRNLVKNGSFSSKTSGWKVDEGTAKLKTKKTSKGRVAVLKAKTDGATVVLNDKVNSVQRGEAGVTYLATAKVKSNREKLSGQLRVREVSGDQVVTHAATLYAAKVGWQKVSLEFTTTLANSALDLNVLAWNTEKKRAVFVDSVTLKVVDKVSAGGDPDPTPTPTPTPTPDPTTGTSTGFTLSNGCKLNARGIGDCAPLLGAAHGSNTDPTSLEADMGRRLGVRRTYWGSTQIDSAVRIAKTDVAAGRIPWISFKLPHSWPDMVAGKGDSWAKDLAAKIATVDGPVWVAFHHEPEGDGDITAWTKMQERLGPIIRTAPNAGFSVILMGWHQLYGDEKYSLDSLWPKTKVDIAGFDLYCFYGTWKDGEYRTGEASLKSRYFTPIGAWAKSKGIAWGLAETGLTDAASKDYPSWIRTTYNELDSTGAMAMSYFDTTLNSTDSYSLTGGQKDADYAAALKGAPTFPKQ